VLHFISDYNSGNRNKYSTVYLLDSLMTSHRTSQNFTFKFSLLASCLINAWPLRANEMGSDHQLSGGGIVVWIHSFIERDLFDNNR